MPIFANIGESHQVFSNTPPNGYIEMERERPGVDYIAGENGKWIFDSSALFSKLRTERDRRLAATDFLLMPDYPISGDQRAVVQAYRQALRDLPAQEGAPWDGGAEDTPWPEIPNVLQERQGSSTSSVYTPGVV